jgi:hypothetical protein
MTSNASIDVISGENWIRKAGPREDWVRLRGKNLFFYLTIVVL